MGPVQQALSDSGLKSADLGKILMVGGSSRIPAVQEAVKRFTGKEPFKGINPDECVAMGAALQAGVLGGQVTGLLLLDVTPLSLGIETLGGVCTRLIDRNTTLPITKSQIFSTAQNFQTSVEINVLQGERQMARDNKSLGKFKLTGIRRAPRGVPQIEVTFNIDANGIVNVSAKDLGTGKQQAITITASSNLSQEDIDRAIRDAQHYAAEDQARKEEATAKDELEQLMFQAQAARKLTHDQKKARSEVLKEATRAKKSKDPAQMRQSIAALQSLIASFGSGVEYDESGAQDAEYEDADEE
jgi:molecular chaperone DnaK